MNLSQVSEPNTRFVYIFGYILGAKRIAFFGVYDKARDRFTIDGGCRYLPNQLSPMVKTWKERDTVYVANSVRDRFTEKINFYLDRDQIRYPDYVKSKYVLGYIDNLLSEEELNERYPGAYADFLDKFERETETSELTPDYDYRLLEYIDNLRKSLRDYEAKINRLDLDTYNLPRVDLETRREVDRITRKIYSEIQYGSYETDAYYNSLQQCPDLQRCREEIGEDCQIYFYGESETGLLSPLDLRSLM